MLDMTDSVRSFLETATERYVKTVVEIVRRSNGDILQRIETTPDDILDGEKLAITGGNVRVDTGAEVLRTLSLELVDPNREISVGIGKLIDLDTLIRVYKGYRIDPDWGSGEYVTWPLGVFVLNGKPEIDATGGQRIIHLQGGDKSCLANRNPRGGFKTAYRVSQGTAKKAAVQAIAQYETWGETEFNLTDQSTATVPGDQPFEDQKSPWEAAQKINSIPEPDGSITRLYYDPNGRLTMVVDPGPDITSLPAVWTAKPTTVGISQLVGARLASDIFSLRNACRVRFGSSRAAPGVVLDHDNDPNSPTYVGKIGWLIKDWKNGQQDDLIRNASEALARAQYERRRDQAYQESVPLRLLENPALEPWDVVQAEESQADINAKYQLLSFTIDLGNSGVMEAEGWRVRAIG